MAEDPELASASFGGIETMNPDQRARLSLAASGFDGMGSLGNGAAALEDAFPGP